MSDDVPAFDREFALAVAFADRVTAGLSIHLEWLDRPFITDTFDPSQGVQLNWRRLNGMTQPDDLERLLKSQLPLTKERIEASNQAGASVAAAAIDVIVTLLDDFPDEVQRCAAVAGSALRVAMEMDRTAAHPPNGQRSWAAFELRGQADLVDFVADMAETPSRESLHELRQEAGAEAMAYRRGMKGLAVGA
jgi:hypothetical protein